jgi:hypothetical protein
MATVDNNDFIEGGGLDIVDAAAFKVTGRGLTCFKGASAAFLAFSVRIHLHGPLTSSTGGRMSLGIRSSRQQCARWIIRGRGSRWCDRKWGCIDIDMYYDEQCSFKYERKGLWPA